MELNRKCHLGYISGVSDAAVNWFDSQVFKRADPHTDRQKNYNIFCVEGLLEEQDYYEWPNDDNLMAELTNILRIVDREDLVWVGFNQ